MSLIDIDVVVKLTTTYNAIQINRITDKTDNKMKQGIKTKKAHANWRASPLDPNNKISNEKNAHPFRRYKTQIPIKTLNILINLRRKINFIYRIIKQKERKHK